MRGREGERRTAPARGDWPERNAPRHVRRSRSRSPIKSKLMAMAMSVSAGGKSHDRDRDERGKSGANKGRKEIGRGHSKDRDNKKMRMRMDDLDDKRIKKCRSPEPFRSDARVSGSGTGKKKSSLDKVVRKAREERNNYWDKKVLEAEEKDPQRWGHSGFKELYQKDLRKGKGVEDRRHRRSRSSSYGGRKRNRSSPLFKHDRASGGRSRSKSRSRSPINRTTKSRKDHRSFSRSRSVELHPRKDNSSANRLKNAKETKSSWNKSAIGGHNSSNKATTSGTKPAHDSGKRTAPRRQDKARRSSSFTSSDSSSISRSRTPKKRTSGGNGKIKVKDSHTKRTKSDSYSSSGSSSDDNDVLQLHARNRGRSSSISNSSASSSSSLSRSPSVGAVRRPTRMSTSSSSSVSGSSSDDSESDVSIRAKPSNNKPSNSSSSTTAKAKSKLVGKSVTKPVQSVKKPVSTSTTTNTTQVPTKKVSNTTVTPTAATKLKQKVASSPTKITTSIAADGKKSTVSPVKSSTSATKTSVIANQSKTGISKTVPSSKTTTPQVSKASAKTKSSTAVDKPTKKPGKAKSPSESGETESETESSDSDSEPRMTLSERFAKLAQMSTDKREMAKPILSVNEIDTKMRVVKDLRHPETPKVYVADAGVRQSGPTPTSADKIKPRNRSPPKFPTEFGRRDPSEERKRHFERMYRDAPTERPLDWSDARVRFSYYKNRGCFDERPITFDEYLKWEDWYHKYSEWLEETEGYYNGGSVHGHGPPGPRGRPGPGPPRGGPPPQNYNRQFGPRGRDFHGGPPRDPMGGPQMSNRTHFGRPEGNAYLEGSIGRRIDRTPGGSLVVNIRQGGNNGNGSFSGNGHGYDTSIKRRVGPPNRPR